LRRQENKALRTEDTMSFDKIARIGATQSRTRLVVA
jgi:hypothetical protein